MATQDDRFAEAAVRMKFCSKEQMDACRTMQAQDPDPAALADILRFNGVLTDDQVAAVEASLAEKKAPPPPKPAPKPAPKEASKPAGRTVTTPCIMCDTVIEAVPDDGGRVRCTECGTCFVPR